MTRSIKVVLRNPLNFSEQIDYTIETFDHELSNDWATALKGLLRNNNLLEKNYCFMGFPKTARTIEYLCSELTTHVATINNYFPDYQITETYSPETVRGVDYAENGVNHETMNKLHTHFERLQGTVWGLSDYYKRANYDTKYAIRQLNNICHEIENLILSQRKLATDPYWVRPSQITTFINSPRVELKDSHRELFNVNGYDRVLGGVYMHWTQIGKTLYEVFRDEHAPELTDTVCEAINELRFYSGEFDVEWANDIVLNGGHPWHDKEQKEFRQWLIANGKDPTDPRLSLGYLPLGQIDLTGSFGTSDYQTIWDILGSHLDIYQIELDGVTAKFEYCWSDSDYKQRQIDMMKPGYDYSSRG